MIIGINDDKIYMLDYCLFAYWIILIVWQFHAMSWYSSPDVKLVLLLCRVILDLLSLLLNDTFCFHLRNFKAKDHCARLTKKMNTINGQKMKIKLGKLVTLNDWYSS